MVRVISTILVFLVVQASWSQSFKDRLAAMQSEYTKLENVHIKMEIKVFENERKTQPYFNEVADIKRQAERYHSQFGATSLLVNSDFVVMIDKASKEIVCTKRSSKDASVVPDDPFNASLDSILSYYGDPILISKNADQEHYQLNQKNGAIKQVDLFINSRTNLISKLEYRYDDAHYVAITFMLIEKNPTFRADAFDEKQYVILDKGKLKVSPAYVGYHLAVADGEQKY